MYGIVCMVSILILKNKNKIWGHPDFLRIVFFILGSYIILWLLWEKLMYIYKKTTINQWKINLFVKILAYIFTIIHLL